MIKLLTYDGIVIEVTDEMMPHADLSEIYLILIPIPGILESYMSVIPSTYMNGDYFELEIEYSLVTYIDGCASTSQYDTQMYTIQTKSLSEFIICLFNMVKFKTVSYFLGDIQYEQSFGEDCWYIQPLSIYISIKKDDVELYRVDESDPNTFDEANQPFMSLYLFYIVDLFLHRGLLDHAIKIDGLLWKPVNLLDYEQDFKLAYTEEFLMLEERTNCYVMMDSTTYANILTRFTSCIRLLNIVSFEDDLLSNYIDPYYGEGIFYEYTIDHQSSVDRFIFMMLMATHIVNQMYFCISQLTEYPDVEESTINVLVIVGEDLIDYKNWSIEKFYVLYTSDVI